MRSQPAWFSRCADMHLSHIGAHLLKWATMSALTRRQWQMARLIVHGLTNAQIGAELGLTSGTAANQV
jgi:DNA-binding NarL/FixJ family response regulator